MNTSRIADAEVGFDNIERLLFLLLVVYVLSTFFSRTFPTVVNTLVVVILVVILWTVGIHGHLRVTRLQLLGLIFLGLAVISHVLAAGTAIFVAEHLVKTKSLGLVCILTLSSVITMRGRSRTRYVWAAIAVATAIVGPLSLLKITVGLPIGYGPSPARTYGLPIPAIPRGIGVTITYGMYGIIASIGASFLIGVLRRPRLFYPERSRTRVRVFAVILLAGIGLAVFITRSRSTFAAFGGVFTVYCLIALFDLADRFGAPITAVCTGLAGGLVVPRVVDLALSVVNAQSGSVSLRLQQYTYGASLLSEYPLSGVGAGYFLARTEFYLHNFWLMMGVWSGVPGLFSWLCLFGFLWYRSLRLIGSPDGRIRAYSIVMLAAMAGVTIELVFFPGLNDALVVGIAILLGPSDLGE